MARLARPQRLGQHGAVRDSPAVGAHLDLYWIPLGAGARVVRISGKIYETVAAALKRRQRCDLYHSALVATLPDACVFIEMAPVFDDRGEPDRGVVAEGAVGSRLLGRFRVFRYEVRRWRDRVHPRPDLCDEPHPGLRRRGSHRTPFSSSYRVSPPSFGVATNSTLATCGTRTPSSLGFSRWQASRRRRETLRPTAGRLGGMQV